MPAVLLQTCGDISIINMYFTQKFHGVKENHMAGIFTQYKGLRKEIYILFWGNIVTTLGATVWPMFSLILSRKMGMGAERIAFITILSGIVVLPAIALGGRLGDSRSKKKIIVVCDFFSVAIYMLCALVPLSMTTIGLMLAAAVFQSIEQPVYEAFIADLSATKDRTRAYSLLYLGSNIGYIFGPTIGGFLLENHMPLIFIINGLAIASSTILIILFVKNTIPSHEGGEDSSYQKAEKENSIFQVFRKNPTLLLYFLISALYMASYNQFHFLLPIDMGHIHGAKGSSIVGTLMSLNGFLVVILTPVMTKMAARTADTVKYLAGTVLTAVSYLLLVFFMGNIPVYYAMAFLLTVGEVISTIAAGPYETKRIPSSHRSRANSSGRIFRSIAVGASEWLMGRVYDQNGSGTAWILTTLLAATASFLCLIWISSDRKRYPKLYH